MLFSWNWQGTLSSSFFFSIVILLFCLPYWMCLIKLRISKGDSPSTDYFESNWNNIHSNLNQLNKDIFFQPTLLKRYIKLIKNWFKITINNDSLFFIGEWPEGKQRYSYIFSRHRLSLRYSYTPLKHLYIHVILILSILKYWG